MYAVFFWYFPPVLTGSVVLMNRSNDLFRISMMLEHLNRRTIAAAILGVPFVRRGELHGKGPGATIPVNGFNKFAREVSDFDPAFGGFVAFLLLLLLLLRLRGD